LRWRSIGRMVFLTVVISSVAFAKQDLETKVKAVQKYLKENKISGWLLYDFHGNNPVATEFVQPKGMQTRRWYYFIPQSGSAWGLVHRIEQANFKGLYGKFEVYSSWDEQKRKLKDILAGHKELSMEYSPLNAIPYVSRVDAGTVELLQSFGIKVISSADLVQYFQARWDKEAYLTHKEAVKSLMEIKDKAFKLVREKIKKNQKITEYDLQQFIWNQYKQYNMISDYPPICAVNENAGNPHYEPTKEIHKEIKKGDFLLIDIWAKKNQTGSIYGDITWTAYVGEKVPEKYVLVFNLVKQARDEAVKFLKDNWKKKTIYGWQVDDVSRGVIKKAGYADFFTHRTGHSISTEVHGNGVNIDNFETRDERKIITGVGFSIEPGVYLKNFGVRSEIDVYAGEDSIEVTSLPLQTEIIPLLK